MNMNQDNKEREGKEKVASSSGDSSSRSWEDIKEERDAQEIYTSER